MPREAWSRYWASGALHSCSGSFDGNYGGALAAFWHEAFAALPPGARVLDIGCGNGPLAQLLLDTDGSRGMHYDGIDLAQIAPAWAADHPGLHWHPGQRAEALPFDDGSVALVTLSFGLRNMTDPAAALREVTRVLAPGGHLVLLEFSKPAAWFAPFYGVHARYVIPRIGAAVARDRAAYAYLVESIDRFPDREDIAREIVAAGLDLVEERAFMFGVARMHVGRTP